MSVKETFEYETGLKLVQDTSFYDLEYGHYRYVIESDSFLKVMGLIESFNKNHCRYIKPQIIDNKIMVYL